MMPAMRDAQRRRSPRLHPATRSLIRWRAEHLARAARLLQRGEAEWEWTIIDRYVLYDSGTSENPRESLSPRRLAFPNRHVVEIPALRTELLSMAAHQIEVTPAMLEDAELWRRKERLKLPPTVFAERPVWERYVWAPTAPTIFQRHPRDGVTPSQQTRPGITGWDGLRQAAAILGILATADELSGTPDLDDIAGS